MKKIEKLIFLTAILLSFSAISFSAVKEIKSLDDISNEIIGAKTTTKKVTKEVKEKVKESTKEVFKETKKEIVKEDKAENLKTEDSYIPEEETTRTVDKNSIVDFYDRRVKDKIAYKGDSDVPFTGVFGVVIDDKIVSYEEYKDGLLDGETAYFAKNKEIKLLSEMYTKGKLNGQQKSYFENGRLKSIVYYTNDRIKGIVAYDRSGKLLHKSMFEDGTGDWKFYWSNGKVSEEGKYKSWRKDGIWKTYREDGSLDTVRKYDNGRLLSETWN